MGQEFNPYVLRWVSTSSTLLLPNLGFNLSFIITYLMFVCLLLLLHHIMNQICDGFDWY